MGFEASLFVEPPNDTLMCDICTEVLQDATTACCEGHAFCKACLKPSVSVCPSCRGSLQKTNCLPLQRIIESLTVRCPNKPPSDHHDDGGEGPDDDDDDNGEEEGGAPRRSSRKSGGGGGRKNPQSPKSKRRKTGGGASSSSSSSAKKKALPEGCGWTGPLSDLDRHRKSCKFQPIPCAHGGCDRSVPRKDLKKHVGSCAHRPVKCVKCKQTVPHNALKDHACPKETVKCPYCDERMLREELAGAGSPTYCKGPRQFSLAAAVGAPSSSASSSSNDNNNGNDDDDDEEGDSIKGSAAFRDIVNERVRHVPTDAECDGHYKVCPNVPLRCEFHAQGCTDPIARKDLASHHAESAQRHAKLVADALSSLPSKVEERLSRERMTLSFSANGSHFMGYQNYKNMRSDTAALHGRSYYVKLYQDRDANEPVRIGVGSIVGSVYQTIQLELHDIHLRVLDKAPGGDDDGADDEVSAKNGFMCTGPHVMEAVEYGTVEFSTPLVWKSENAAPCVMLNSHLRELVESHGRIFVAASFSVSKKFVKNLGGVYHTSSPCPSPSRDDSDSD